MPRTHDNREAAAARGGTRAAHCPLPTAHRPSPVARRPPGASPVQHRPAFLSMTMTMPLTRAARLRPIGPAATPCPAAAPLAR